jgi:hypothetical protein
MIRTRKDKGNFIGLYLGKQQFDIVHSVAKSRGITVSNLIRMSIARDIEPMYQASLTTEGVNHAEQN